MSKTIPLEPALGHLRRHLPIAVDGRDLEGVHQVRVAARRLGVWIELSGRTTLGHDLAWLRRAAGEVRDLDVLLQLDLPGPLARDLRTRHARARGSLALELESPRCCGLVEALQYLAPLPVGLAKSGRANLVKLVVRRGERVDAADGEPRPQRRRLHDLRRAARRLRYAGEWLGRKDPTLKRLQNTLGRLGDLEQLRLRVRDCPDRRQLVDFETDLNHRLDGAHVDALAAWRRARDHVQSLAGDTRR